MRKLFNRKTLAKCLLFFGLVNFSMPMFSFAQSLQAGTGVSMDLKILPTSIVVTPAFRSVLEGSPAVQYIATAYYDYPGAPTPIAPKDVSSDALTTWGTDNVAIALVNTIGLVTPVSDLGTGAAHTQVRATYAGVTGQASLTVTGVVPTPGGGGGGGGGNIYPPNNNPPVNNPPVDNNPPTDNNTPPTDVNNPPTDSNNPPNNTNPPDNTTPQNPNGGEVPKVIFGQEQTPYLPLENPVKPEDIKPIEEAPVVPPDVTGEGVSRAYVAGRIADKLNLLELRGDLLNRCYADLQNCTNIFRMYSSYEGINLDPNDLRLFPDVDGVKQKNQINKMALLGIVQGYYGIKDGVSKSPFLPNKSISKVETLKILTTILETLKKGSPDYKVEGFDYNTLFYQEIYAASLLSELSKLNTVAQVSQLPNSFVAMLKIAHALSDEAWVLIKAQKTPFKDVRPDLYDAHWYYPIVYNKLCAEKLIDCRVGVEVKPDDVPTVKEVDEYIGLFAKYITDKSLDKDVVGDIDSDGIPNLDENLIYFTSPRSADTDGDNVTDGQEINAYKTNPNLADTDSDGLKDGEEINTYKTDPNLADTDEDGFDDGLEIAEGTNPLDKNSTPDDKNHNFVSDAWELKYNIDVKDGSQDTDGDGISDLLEYKYGTNPTKVDTDADGFTDSEEILDYLSDPNDAASPGDPANFPVVINNFQYGQLVAEPSPMIKGVGPASLGDNVVQIQVLLRNEFGSELVLGSTTTDAKGRFVFVPTIEIKNGTYYLMARSINKGEVKSSSPIKIIVDSTLQIANAKPEKIEKSPITDEVLLKNLVLKVDSTDGRPVLYGNLSEFGSRVNVTWQSLVVSSALIADSTDGSFSMKAPLLEPGRHTVYLQTVRKRDNAMGKTIKISFNLGVINSETVNENGRLGLAGIFSMQGIADFFSRQTWPFWIGLVSVIVLGSSGIYFFALGKDDRKKKKK